MADFDYYELRGVIAPGAALVAVVVILWPGIPLFSGTADFSLGELGAFLVLSYVTGHIVAGLGNLVEAAYWKPQGGRPTDQALAAGSPILSGAAREGLAAALRDRLGVAASIESIPAAEWTQHTRAMVADVSARGRASRIEAFNSNYGLFRGLVVALLLDAILVAHQVGRSAWPIILLLILGALVCVARMHRFAKYYASELFAQFRLRETKP